MASEIPIDTNVDNQPDQGQADAAQVAELQEKLASAEQQRQELLRTLAEYENVRKRANRDLEAERKFACAKFAADLLPALDNLERAVEAARKAGEASTLVQGVQATQTLLLDVLKRYGITPIDAPPGEPFDPSRHQAVSMQPAANQPAHSIVQVLQPGFMIHDRVLRPAAVVVAAGG
jgi:molecular chaperone GrpE